ncbi:receptor kinase At4g00960 [Olea europaea subsp. europaea]|uniref:Receptor kinase At4g00960 n=1 Tax=Olea europaea subsp. europaea TaxID=158383 RepID=A0A8S0QRM5_OLEEU|nr:receptor kinase At4g00960 [Olea europaea subsp. europaea]
MSSWIRLALIIFLNLTNFLSTVKSRHWCLNNGNYTSNSPYKRNLDNLLLSISSLIDVNGFYSASYGENSDRVHAMGLCRGDHQLDTCRSCINNATNSLLQFCPNQKQAIIWVRADQCMVRYSNESIFGQLATDPRHEWYVVFDSPSREEFNRDLRTLLDNLRRQAVYGGASKKFAATKSAAPDGLTLYGLVQCTPDLSSDDCSDCLIQVAEIIPRCCNGKQGFGVYCPSCLLRYETYLFYNESSLPPPPPPMSLPPPPLPAPQGKDENTTRTIIIIIVPIIVGLIVALCIGIFLRFRQNQKPMEKVETHNEISTVESLCYEFDTIRAATDDFSNANMLGQGGFGIVYKGKLVSGQEIAVKRLSMNSRQGDLEFKNEVMLVASLQHVNLVRLLGFSLKGSERLLVYEFVENGSLDHFLFDPIKRPNLDWDRRYEIIRGIAKGVLYLHEDSRLKIIHRDLKAGNILLDGKINPKISDFGMARLFVQDQTHCSTSRIVGTYGYMALEYAFHGKFSSKSDVFSFGVLVLEIICGQKVNSFQNGENVEDLLSCAWKNWHEGTAENVIDSTLRTSSRSLQDIIRCIHIGLLCVQQDAADRPTMTSIVIMLTRFSITLPIPSQPAFFVSSNFDPKLPLLQDLKSIPSQTKSSSNRWSSNSACLSINDATVSEFYPR